MLTSRSARADDETGFTLGPNLMLFQPRLGSSQFSGSGTPYGANGPMNFDHRGSEFGVHAPVFLAAELRLGVQRRYFEIGGQFFAGTSLGDSGNGASDPDAQQLAHTSGMSAYGGGLHAVVTIPAGIVTFAVGPDFGVRAFDVPLTGFEPTVCHNKYGTYSCPETATSTQPYFQPRFTMIVHGDPHARAGFYFGPWVGVDVYPQPSWAGGFSFGWGFNQNYLR